MLRLIRMGKQFAVESEYLFELGTSQEMSNVLWNLDINDEEIDLAFTALGTGDIEAHFGVNKTFIYSKAA